jgi:NADPH-dependent 2,4-dienoyl-CoA reductase/sulfur reductase-like enzyme
MQRRHFLATAAASTAAAVLLPGCDKAPRVLEGGFTGIDMARGHQLRDWLKAGSWPAPAVVRRAQVVIAGGGVAGLAAARSLRLAGIADFALLELEDSAGGNSRGGAVQGVACPPGTGR